MNRGRFAVQHRRPGTGWRLDEFRFQMPETADGYSAGPVFADADTRVVEISNGLLTIVGAERTVWEKRHATTTAAVVLKNAFAVAVGS